MEKKKVLIIKTGYSEILDRDENSRIVSLGDIFRTTPLLHLYKDNHVTWVTDSKAMPLLKGNPLIDRLIPYDYITVDQLKAEEFDVVINLEKTPGICAVADVIRARKSKYGFTLNTQTGEAEALESSSDILFVSSNLELKKKNTKTAQKLLFEMVGEKWNNEEYILGYKSQSLENYDVCLNTLVGEKWPIKAWSSKNWDSLEKKLQNEGLKVTRQDKQPKKLFSDITKYIDWINSGNIIVTNDSLGLHLGLALKKKVLGLFGPTPYKEIYFYKRGKAIRPSRVPECAPCFGTECTVYNNSCMNLITPKKVFHEVIKLKNT